MNQFNLSTYYMSVNRSISVYVRLDLCEYNWRWLLALTYLNLGLNLIYVNL